MQHPDLQKYASFLNRWVALDLRGGKKGIVTLRNGVVVVDVDEDVGSLCARLAREGRSSVEIVYCCDTRPAAVAA